MTPTRENSKFVVSRDDATTIPITLDSDTNFKNLTETLSRLSNEDLTELLTLRKFEKEGLIEPDQAKNIFKKIYDRVFKFHSDMTELIGAKKGDTYHGERANGLGFGGHNNNVRPNTEIQSSNPRPGEPRQPGSVTEFVPPPTTKPSFKEIMGPANHKPTKLPTQQTSRVQTEPPTNADDLTRYYELICPYHRRSGHKSQKCNHVCIWELLSVARVCTKHQQFGNDAKTCHPPCRYARGAVRLIRLEDYKFIPINFFNYHKIYSLGDLNNFKLKFQNFLIYFNKRTNNSHSELVTFIGNRCLRKLESIIIQDDPPIINDNTPPPPTPIYTEPLVTNDKPITETKSKSRKNNKKKKNDKMFSDKSTNPTNKNPKNAIENKPFIIEIRTSNLNDNPPSNKINNNNNNRRAINKATQTGIDDSDKIYNIPLKDTINNKYKFIINNVKYMARSFRNSDNKPETGGIDEIYVNYILNFINDNKLNIGSSTDTRFATTNAINNNHNCLNNQKGDQTRIVTPNKQINSVLHDIIKLNVDDYFNDDKIFPINFDLKSPTNNINSITNDTITKSTPTSVITNCKVDNPLHNNNTNVPTAISKHNEINKFNSNNGIEISNLTNRDITNNDIAISNEKMSSNNNDNLINTNNNNCPINCNIDIINYKNYDNLKNNNDAIKHINEQEIINNVNMTINNNENISPNQHSVDLDAEWTVIKNNNKSKNPNTMKNSNAISNCKVTDSSEKIITKLNIANSKRNISLLNLIDLQHEKIRNIGRPPIARSTPKPNQYNKRSTISTTDSDDSDDADSTNSDILEPNFTNRDTPDSPENNSDSSDQANESLPGVKTRAQRKNH